MPVNVIDSKVNSTAIETAISDWEGATTFTSIDHVDIEATGSNRALITIIYTA